MGGVAARMAGMDGSNLSKDELADLLTPQVANWGNSFGVLCSNRACYQRGRIAAKRFMFHHERYRRIAAAKLVQQGWTVVDGLPVCRSCKRKLDVAD